MVKLRLHEPADSLLGNRRVRLLHYPRGVHIFVLFLNFVSIYQPPLPLVGVSASLSPQSRVPQHAPVQAPLLSTRRPTAALLVAVHACTRPETNPPVTWTPSNFWKGWLASHKVNTSIILLKIRDKTTTTTTNPPPQSRETRWWCISIASRRVTWVSWIAVRNRLAGGAKQYPLTVYRATCPT